MCRATGWLLEACPQGRVAECDVLSRSNGHTRRELLQTLAKCCHPVKIDSHRPQGSKSQRLRCYKLCAPRPTCEWGNNHSRKITRHLVAALCIGAGISNGIGPPYNGSSADADGLCLLAI